MGVKKMPPLILASVSPRRKELLSQLDVKFSVLPSGAKELHDEGIEFHPLPVLPDERKQVLVLLGVAHVLGVGLHPKHADRPTLGLEWDAERILGLGDQGIAAIGRGIFVRAIEQGVDPRRLETGRRA